MMQQREARNKASALSVYLVTLPPFAMGNGQRDDRRFLGGIDFGKDNADSSRPGLVLPVVTYLEQ